LGEYIPEPRDPRCRSAAVFSAFAPEQSPDGKVYPAKGNLAWNASAYKVVHDRTNEITTMKDGKVVSTGRITVSADGKSRTLTMNGTGPDGKKFSGKAVYDKS
jgi:hypothetical protein